MENGKVLHVVKVPYKNGIFEVDWNGRASFYNSEEMGSSFFLCREDTTKTKWCLYDYDSSKVSKELSEKLEEAFQMLIGSL